MDEEQLPKIDMETGLPAVYGGLADQVYEEDVYVTGVYEGPEQLPATIFIGIG